MSKAFHAREGGRSSPLQRRTSVLGTLRPARKFGLPRLLTALAAATALLAVICAPQAAFARAYTYGTGAQRTVNAGIILVDGNPTPTLSAAASPQAVADNIDPYVFYVLNQRTDIRPYGWNIVNPLAPKSVTAQIQARWDSRTSNSPAGAAFVAANYGHAYQMGQVVTPAMAAYWEVRLSSTTSTDLAQYDILLLNIDSNCSLTASESAKLAKFVDGGGTLWVENSAYSGGNINAIAPLFFNLQFAGTTPGGGGAVLPATILQSSIVNTPYTLSQADLNSLGDKHIGDYTVTSNSGLLSPVLLNQNGGGGAPIIAAGQYGAGQIVVTNTGSADTINDYVGGISIYTNGIGSNSGPYSGTAVQLAPTADLKLLSNIIAAADAHASQYQTSHNSNVAVNPLSSAVQTWKQTFLTASAPTGAVISGHLVYATVGDTLYAYDLIPSEDLNGDGNPDDGIADYGLGQPYDVVWTATVGPNASAPTVAVLPDGAKVVFVVAADGTIGEFDAASGTASTINGSGGRGTYNAPAPAATYYDGRVFAGGADGSLCIQDILEGAASALKYYPNSAGAGNDTVTAPPTVGLMPAGDGSIDNSGSDLLVLLSTNRYVYSIYLGTIGEQLNGGVSYRTKLIGKLPKAQIDNNTTTRPFRTYALNTNGTPFAEGLVPGGGPPAQQFTGTVTNPPGVTTTPPVYADYGVDLNYASSTGAGGSGSITRHLTGVGTIANVSNPNGTGPIVSPPVMDNLGNVYYTAVNPYDALNPGVPSGRVVDLVSFHDSPDTSGAKLNWVFQLPATTGIFDADGTNYSQLAGATFYGAPVVDSVGNVYALASGPNGTAVLCFNSKGSVTADINAQVVPGSIGSPQLTQPDPAGTGNDLFGNTIATLSRAQASVDSSGHVELRNFGKDANVGTPAQHGIFAVVAEPYPLSLSFSAPTAGNGNAPQNGTQSTAEVLMHTNLSWYTIIPGVALSASSGLAKAGNTLYFADSNGNLDQVIADPQSEGIGFNNKFADPASTGTTGGTMFTKGNSPAGIGTIIAAPSISNGSMVLVGNGGVAAYTNQVTVVVDNNRVLEADSSGNVQWAVDSTTKVSLKGDDTPIYSINPATNAPGNGQLVTTVVPFSHPTALTELTQNDYLVADTGNNRCVRFDRAGRVVWELTKFSDPNHILQGGEPTTLNQPTSVQIFTHSAPNGNILVRYLVSDTGNYRVVEVDDEFGSNGQPLPGLQHVLVWASHTHDVQGREYRYQSAAFYHNGGNNQEYVVALVTNKRIAALPATNPTDGSLAPSNQDAPGGSIVLLNYAPGTPIDGDIDAVVNSFQAPLVRTLQPPDANNQQVPVTRFDLGGGLALAQNVNTPTVNIRNPRYLKAYTPPTASPNSSPDLLLADDNGVWDLVLISAGQPYFAKWGFTQADYQNMVSSAGVLTPLDAQEASRMNGAAANPQPYTPRLTMPFVPSCIQVLPNADTVSIGGNTGNINQYLVTNSFAQGESANAIGGGTAATGDLFPGFGGEVFVISHTPNGTTIGAGFDGHTLSRPTNSSPLMQPSFAYRVQ